MNSVTEKIMKHKFPMFEIDGLPIGPFNECFVIAEVGQAHEGSLGADINSSKQLKAVALMQ